MTLQKIREELKEIQYYYSMQNVFDRNSKIVPQTRISNLLLKYTNVIQKAPAMIYIVYAEIYMNGATQKDLAFSWGVSRETIKYRHKKLLEFLFENLEDE